VFIPGAVNVVQNPALITASLGSLTTHEGIQLVADDANTDTIYIGPETNVSAPNSTGVAGFPLKAGRGVYIPTSKADKLYAMSPTGTQLLNFFVV
jgi:hypothetical protein